MKIIHTIDEWQQLRETFPSSLSVGFVPTMGNLHPGHVSLYATSQSENDCTVASIFINPAQFNQPDDFTNYPRTLETDLALLESIGVNFCFLPNEQAMYADAYRYQLQENKQSQRMEGEHRPGHFTGVLTVVMKLLNLVNPNRAYFGEKDYQQYQLIRDMVAAFFMTIDIKSCPTIREASGLAYSSRNNRLTDEQRQLADKFAHIFHQSALAPKQIMSELNDVGISVEYIQDHDNRRFAAVNIGDIRLIDNYSL